MNARIQQMAIGLGGDIEYFDGQTTPDPDPVDPGDRGGAAARSWEYWLRTLPLD